jgi:hypothetical protein
MKHVILRRPTRLAGFTALTISTFVMAACDGNDPPAPTPLSDAGVISDAGTAGADASDALVSMDLPVQVDLNAGDDAIANYAGVWTGATDQKRPVSFVMSEDGTLTDVSMEIELTSADGLKCTTTFVADKLPRVVGGRARLQLRSTLDRFVLPVTLEFNTETGATVAQAGYTGKYKFSCDDDMTEGEGPLLAASRFTVQRAHGVTAPAGGDRQLASAAGSPLPMGGLDTGCSTGGGNGRRFCAFARYGSAGEAQLWVAAVDDGTTGSPACDPDKPSATCQLLTSKLYLGGAAAPTMSRFHGDTLLFQAESWVGAGTRYPQATWVWRPGWSEARLALDAAASCRAEEHSDALACFSGMTKTATGSWEADLWAGHLGDGSQPLQKAAHVMVIRAADATTPKRTIFLQYDITADGQELLWSARATDDPAAKETLWTLKIGEPPANARVLGTDVGRWELSHDGKKLFWLAGIDRARAGNPQPGYLEMVDFPVPTAPVRIGADLVSQYFEIDDPGSRPRHQLVFLTPAGSLRHVADADGAPLVHRELDDGVSVIRNWSPGGAAVAYSKDVSGWWGDLFVAVPVTGAVCQADAENQWSDPVFSSSGRYILAEHAWFDPVAIGRLELVNSLTCKSKLLAGSSRNWLRIPDDRFVIASDPLPLRKYDLVSLGIVDPEAASPLSAQVEIAAGPINVSTRSTASGNVIDLMYAVNAGWKTDGLYQRAITLPKR